LSDQAPEGLLVVDKPEQWTSHDVVARVRRLAGTRKVGHAGTLDPMATGVLLLGLGRATRLLGHLALADKSYDATIRLGQATTTDDAEGEVSSSADASAVTREEVDRAAEPLRGDILQVPSKVSAIKIDGQRAYKLVRSGADVAIPARPVHVDRLEVADVRAVGAFLDVDVHVDCSTGTYIRALARDLGEALGVGGHLTMLRRTRIGSVDVQQAHRLDALSELAPEDLPYLTLDEASRMFFDWHVVDDDLVAAVRNGRAVHVRLRPSTAEVGDDPVAVLAPDGTFLALYEQHGPVAKAVAVFSPA
jgi:tRNA pseudouridine55 synthase